MGTVGILNDLDETFWDPDEKPYHNVVKFNHTVIKNYNKNYVEFGQVIYFITARPNMTAVETQTKIEEIINIRHVRVIVKHVRELHINNPYFDANMAKILRKVVNDDFEETFRVTEMGFIHKMHDKLKKYRDVFTKKTFQILNTIYEHPEYKDLVCTGDTRMVDIFVLLVISFIFERRLSFHDIFNSKIVINPDPSEHSDPSFRDGNALMAQLHCYLKLDKNRIKLAQNGILKPFVNYPRFIIFKDYKDLLL